MKMREIERKRDGRRTKRKGAAEDERARHQQEAERKAKQKIQERGRKDKVHSGRASLMPNNHNKTYSRIRLNCPYVHRHSFVQTIFRA